MIRASWAAAAAAAIAAALLAPGGAGGAVTCDYAASGKILEVRLTQSNDLAQLEVNGSAIGVRDLFGPVACSASEPGATATVANTDVISVSSEPGAVNVTVIIEDSGGLAPGVTSEAPGTSEIETFVNLRNGPGSLVSVRIGDFPGFVRFGTDGVNPNASPTEAVPDRDIFLNNVPEFEGRAAFSNPAFFSAQGGAGTGAALTTPILLQGSGAADELTGGEGDDLLQAFGAGDTLRGGGGNDTLDPGPGDDTLVGGAGADIADYSVPNYGAGVTLDLALGGVQPSGASGAELLSGIENLRGTSFADVLRGDGGVNAIESLFGADVVEGRGGADDLRAGAGADRVEARDGRADAVDCGADADIAIADATGVDKLAGCERVERPAGPAGGAGPGAGAPGAGPGAAGAGRGPAIRGLRVAPPAFAALASGPSARAATFATRLFGPLVTFRIDRPASVTYRVARRLAGRRARGRCVAPARAASGARACLRLAPVPGRFLRAANAGSNRLRFSGRVGGRALRPGSYRLLATARAGGAAGPTARAAFRITA